MILTIKYSGTDHERWSERQMEKMIGQISNEMCLEERKQIRKAARVNAIKWQKRRNP